MVSFLRGEEKKEKGELIERKAVNTFFKKHWERLTLNFDASCHERKRKEADKA